LIAYSAYFIHFRGTKDGIIKEGSITMLVMELDIPKLEVIINDKFIITYVNSNKYILFQVKLKEGANFDQI